MTYASGQLLVATPRLADPNFARSVILLLDHDEDYRAAEVRLAEQRRGDEQFARPGCFPHGSILVQDLARCGLPPASSLTAAATAGVTSGWETEGMM